MTIFYLDEVFQEAHTAATKAPNDINEIMRREGFTKILLGLSSRINNNVIRKILLAISYLRFLLYVFLRFRANDVLITNFPFVTKVKMKKMLFSWCKLRNVKLILIIHDLDTLRRESSFNGSKVSLSKGESLLCKADKVICHNYRMKEYLISQDICEDKIVELEIFDYLLDSALIIPYRNYEDSRSVTIAGNLVESKSGYIYQYLQSNRNVTLNLFGPNFKGSKEYSNYTYFGSFPPNELPTKLCGSFGLVWDGSSAETCSGSMGRYLRYNNPHKTSLFLASGLPIIIWEDAALAKFVSTYNIGITIASLYELDRVLDSINNDMYREMCLNVQSVAEKIRSGFFTKEAILKSLNGLGVNDV